jgi:hypothetical protein
MSRPLRLELSKVEHVHRLDDGALIRLGRMDSGPATVRGRPMVVRLTRAEVAEILGHAIRGAELTTQTLAAYKLVRDLLVGGAS